MGVAEEWEETEQRNTEETTQLRRQISSLTDALSRVSTKTKSDNCQTVGCDRPIDWYCRYCKGFICTRCSKKACGEESQHQAEDFEEMYKACQSKYMEWKNGKEAAVEELMKQKKKFEAELASDIQKMAGSANNPGQLATPELSRIVAELPQKQKLLEKITKQVEEANASLHSVKVDNLNHQEFIKVFEELDLSSYVFEVTDLNRITLSEKCTTVSKTKCYALDVTPAGEMLMARKLGFDICDKSGNILRSIKIAEGDVTSIQYYKSKVYALLKEPKNNSKKRRAIVFDMPNYVESARWELPEFAYVSMLAVNNDKVYAVDCTAKKVKVYSLKGEELSDFYHSAFSNPIYMSNCPPDGVLVTDWKAGFVYKIDSVKDRIAWQFKVGEPRGVLCDKLGNTWVWDRKAKELFLRSSDGKRTKRFSHKELVATGVDFITGFTMADGKLWIAAYDKGVLSIDMNIAPADESSSATQTAVAAETVARSQQVDNSHQA